MAPIVDAVRFPRADRCSTPLDPIADCLAWIGGLRSTEYAASLLRDVHGLTDRAAILEASKVIRAHAQAALEFMDQAHAGPTRASYLPLYYGMLDLAKIAIVFRGGLRDLEKQRHHGASWSGLTSKAQDFLRDHITIRSKGAIALFYRLIVGPRQPALEGRILLRQVYPLIPSIAFEYDQAYHTEPMLRPVRAYLNQQDDKGWRVEVTAGLGTDEPLDVRSPLLVGLRKFRDGKASRWVSARDASDAHAILGSQIRWWLLYHRSFSGHVFTYTPTRKCKLALPEEFPALLALFHLGNVVRYDPERLARLYDSRAVTVIDPLRRHGLLTYLTAIWSLYTQKHHSITAP
jgi:hypothetical protein